MSGIDSVSKWRQSRAAKDAPPDMPLQEEAPPPDTEEASDRCGLTSTHVQQGLFLELSDGSWRGPLYGMMSVEPQQMLPNGIRFQFQNEEGFWDVFIVGGESEESKTAIRQIAEHLTWGKRASLHTRKGIVEEIRIEKVEAEEE